MASENGDLCHQTEQCGDDDDDHHNGSAACFLIPTNRTRDENRSRRNDTEETSQSLPLPSCLTDLVELLQTVEKHHALRFQWPKNSDLSLSNSLISDPKAESKTTADTSFHLVSSRSLEQSPPILNIELTLAPGDAFSLSFHARCDDYALSCLEYMVDLPDARRFSKIQLSCGPFHDKFRHKPPLFACPFSFILITKLLRNVTWEVELSFYSFSEEQMRLLLSYDAKYRLKLSHCRLELPPDMKKVEDCGPVKLTLCFGDSCASYGQQVFESAEDWLSFLTILDLERLEELSLCEGLVEIPVCQLLGELPLRNLELRHVKLADGGASLVKSVAAGVGPRGLALSSPLYLGRRIFRDPWNWNTFLSHLSGNHNLKRLIIDGNTLQPSDWWSLADALKTNGGLTQLRISYGLYITSECWNELMSAIAVHPSLEQLFFEIIIATPGWNDPSSMLHRTESLARLVSSNRRIYDVEYSFSFDRQVWDKKVAPQLQHNLCMRRATALQQIRCPSLRVATIGACIEAIPIHNDSEQLWLALSMNHDALQELLR